MSGENLKPVTTEFAFGRWHAVLGRRRSEIGRIVPHRRDFGGAEIEQEKLARLLVECVVHGLREIDYLRYRDAEHGICDPLPEALVMSEIHRTLGLIARRGAAYRIISRETAGRWLGVTHEERLMLDLRTFKGIDETKSDREWLKAEKRKRDREYQTAKRRAAGVVPRDEFLANALSTLRPWDAEGVSRRTWERRRVACVSAYTLLESSKRRTCDSDLLDVESYQIATLRPNTTEPHFTTKGEESARLAKALNLNRLKNLKGEFHAVVREPAASKGVQNAKR